MAACGSLHHIFDAPPLPENPTLLESLSWTNIAAPVNPVDQPSFTEIFGELHFKENPQSSSSPLLSTAPILPMSPSNLLSFGSQAKKQYDEQQNGNGGWSNITDEGCCKGLSSSLSSSSSSYAGCHKKSDSFSAMNFESLQLCTEGLGFESSADVEDLKNDENGNTNSSKERGNQGKRVSTVAKLQFSPWGNYYQSSDARRSRTGEAFPPPISSIGKSGKPGVCFKSYREDGRFVLKEIRIPSQEFLHACREDGRLKLHFVQPNDEIPEDEDEDSEEEEDRDAEPEDKVEAKKQDDDD